LTDSAARLDRAIEGCPKGVPAPICIRMLLSLEDVMIHFDEPGQAMPRPRQRNVVGGNPPDRETQGIDARRPDDAPALEDGIWYVSPPAIPFPRVLPGL
jgi:hypothetical protein